jgi:predicted transcriptional regulator
MQRPEWTGDLIGRMHNERVRYEDIGDQLGVSKAYVSMVLSGYRTPQGAQERFEQAFNDVLAARKDGEQDAERESRV